MFVLSPLLVILLILANDLMSMVVSTDRVVPSATPDRWVVRPLLAAALGLATLLLLLSALVFWTAHSVLQLGLAQTQTLDFAWLVFGGQSTLYLARVRGAFWTSRPGRWVLLGTAADVTLITLLATQGWLMAPVPLPLIGGLVVLALVFLVGADALKVWLIRGVSARAPARPSRVPPIR